MLTWRVEWSVAQMIEPELAFADLADNMACATAYLKHCVSHVLEKCTEDLAFFDQFVEKGIVARLQVGRKVLGGCGSGTGGGVW